MFKMQVMVSEDLLERIDKLCDYIGSSRSSVCASIIALALPEWEKSYYSECGEAERAKHAPCLDTIETIDP